MRSQLDERLGVQEPQIFHSPPDVVSLAAAEEAIELADAYGVAGGFPLDESQKFTLRLALGERSDGSWAAATVADFEPRQNGKNDTIAARELAGLRLFGEKLIIHTAHEFPTANESFLRLVSVFENWDDLRKLVARIRYANGEQGIELLSGQRIKYKARSGGSGRGFAKADLLVYDEAQHLKSEHVAASGPARLANPNNQSWYAGSGGLEGSALAWRLRRRALIGDAGRLAYVEHTAEQVDIIDGRAVGTAPDILNREAWALANPAYGRRITDEALLSLYEELGPELFARECLCVWDVEPGEGDRLIPAASWDAVCGSDVKPDGRMAFGVDVGEERDCAAIVAVSEGKAIEVIEGTSSDGLGGSGRPLRSGLGWLPGRLAELNAKWRRPPFAYDAAGPVASVMDNLVGDFDVRPLAGRDLPMACGQFFDDVAEARFRVRRDKALDEAVTGARRTFVGDAWKWVRKDGTVDITPLVAATVGLWAVRDLYDTLDSVR